MFGEAAVTDPSQGPVREEIVQLNGERRPPAKPSLILLRGKSQFRVPDRRYLRAATSARAACLGSGAKRGERCDDVGLDAGKWVLAAVRADEGPPCEFLV